MDGGLSTSRATLPGRLAAKLVREGDCLVWTCARRTPEGYGAIGVWEDGRSKALVVHRVAYELVKGPIPEGMWIDHLCMNKLCADPFHLEAVSPGENTRRGVYFNKAAACRNGHEYTPGSYWTRPNTGTKRCKRCARDWAARRRTAATDGS